MSDTGLIVLIVGCIAFIVITLVVNKFIVKPNYKKSQDTISKIQTDFKENSIEKVLADGFFYSTPYNIDGLRNTAAKIVLVCQSESRAYVITDKMFYSLNGGKVWKFLLSKSSAVRNSFRTTQLLGKSEYKKDRSVVGSAIAGGVIAGGVGAVVGAVSAANTNAKGGKSAYVYSYGDYGLTYQNNWILDCYISNDIIRRFGKPVNTNNSKSGFAYFDTYNYEKKYIDEISNYLSRVIGTMYEESKK